MPTHSNHDPICYDITFKDAVSHYYDVELTTLLPHKESLKVTLPAWLPGSYMIRDFARHIVSIHAVTESMELEVTQTDKQSWTVEPAAGEIKIRYRVYAWDLSVRAAHLDQTHGFFNPSSVCLKVIGSERCPHQLTVIANDIARTNDWCVATGMTAKAVNSFGFGTYIAENYDDLLDYPFEMGTFSEVGFESAGVQHRMIYTGANQGALGRIAADVKQICDYQTEFFGGAPFDGYLFMTMVVGKGYGGLEHKNSTALMCSRNSLITTDIAPQTDEYRDFLGLCSHEYFHSWNVKRIKPIDFTPFDLSQEQYTQQLWAYEGITSYYDELFLCRSGVISTADYLNMLAKSLSRVARGSGKERQTVTESSFNAWTKFYKQDENAPNAIVSYYTKGGEIALCLDLLLRLHSNHQITLDDVMRLLWERHGVTGQGTSDNTIQTYCVELLSPYQPDARALMAVFFHTALDTTDDLPTADLLEWVGVNYILRPQFNKDDKGGKPNAKNPGNHLGALTQAEQAGVKLSVVYDNEPAQRAGLSAGDVIVAIGNTRVCQASIQSVLNEFAPAQQVTVHAFRHDQLMTFKLDVQVSDNCVVQLELFDEVLAEAWLTGVTQAH
ncbi:M61 family metallopeptidase [Echinimonas agarilytica]|uniref:PDZ domain-containing protein n=1 Tax=Echinimonas agarilytica TaxID=1215918 RepID=A0AA41W6X4_9GAMM|nr:PDZ domain-containing protein [Echinimonas agarilytica]MCM2679847.1 PDZ domain-containing protein [Echinimonas agarilytica]